MAGSLSAAPLALVTGATGALGPSVVGALHQAGYAVRTLSLNTPAPALLPASTEIRLGDITDAATVRAAMAGVDVVVHMAALLHIPNPPAELRPKYEKINVGGTANVIEAAKQCGVRRVVFFSTIAVYGYATGQLITEETVPQPDTFYAQTKLDGEKIVLQARRPDGQPLGVVLRLGAAYGTRIKGNYRRLLQALAKRRFIPIGSGHNRRTLIYDQDIAQAALLALEHPQAAGRIYNVTDGEIHTLNAIIEAMCAALGRRYPRLSLPVGPVRWAAGMLEDVAQLVGRQSPIVRATVDKYVEDVAVDGSRIQRELGFTPAYDLASGWRETVAEMRRVGAL